jgi:glycosyltransferase involved in cell wall biosynthesis
MELKRKMNQPNRPTDACIILTYRCQMQCQMCNIWQHPTDVEKEITADELQRLPRGFEFINLTALLSGALFSVVPSLWYENLPNTILESYACGTPVLASDIGSLTGCVNNNETGYLFQPNNPNRLAKYLEKCLDNPQEMLRMGQTARAVALERYSARKHIQSLEELFSELL